MRQMLHIVILALTLAFGWHAEAAAETRQSEDRLVAVDSVHDRQHGAMLSDGQEVYRVCNSRPQRIVRSFVPSLADGNALSIYISHHSNFSSLQRYGYCRIVPVGFQFAASSRDYIFALRHIIR